jgi:hypothetical protein
MNEKQAYCCLECANLPPCDAAAGNCAPCCSDCGDTSICQTSAYFGKNDKIYKGYTTTWSYWAKAYDWDADKELFNESIGGSYDSIKNEKLVFGSTVFNSWLCGSCLCGEGPETAYSLSTTTYEGKTSTTEWSNKGLCRDDCEDCGECDCNAIYKGSFNSNNVPFIPTIDASAPDCDMFKDSNTDSKGTVTFIVPLKTYNGKGEIVQDPTPNRQYDKCHPIRIASAPSCHFFAP